jgi:hypothetical protein
MKLRPLLGLAALLALDLAAIACTSSAPPTDNTAATNATDYCNAITGYINRCNATDECSLEFSKNCAKYAPAFSNTAIQALSACAPATACGDAGILSIPSSCTTPKEVAAGPTSTQRQLAQDYCSSCAYAFSLTADNCVAAFYAGATPGTPIDGGTTTTIGEVGAYFLDRADSIVSDDDTQCVKKISSGTNGCVNDFFDCVSVEEVFDAPTAPSACDTTSSTTSSSIRRRLQKR